MFRLYIDEDSGDRNLVQALRARGVDVVTAQEVGMLERSDEEHLQYATSRDRVLYSFNRGDFLRLHAQYLAEGKGHAGMLLARQQHYSVGEQMRRVLKVMALRSDADMRNCVEFLSAWG
jgi:predicted nuclease of predicted toxin-antitoxin system